MRILVGTDIIEIERIRASIEKLGQPFLNKIYTEAEIAYCENRGRKSTKVTPHVLQQKKPSPKHLERESPRKPPFLKSKFAITNAESHS